jgi:hypothetical protein
VAGLPTHPLRARILGAQYPAGGNGMRMPYPELEEIVCQALVLGERPQALEGKEGRYDVGLVAFTFEDDAIDFENKIQPMLKQPIMLQFGCW